MADDTAFPARHAASAFSEGWLDVGHGHRMWYRVSGAAGGLPLLLVHGGPGSASPPRQGEFHDPARYRIVQFDQRGCGRSEPRGETAHNHSDALIADMESLRVHLGVERWLVAGGSWGAALALVYAAKHRAATAGLLLRGVFLAEHADLEWFFHDVAALAPEAHARFLRALPRRARRHPVAWLARCFSGHDEERQLIIAAAWQRYELDLDHLQTGRTGVSQLAQDERRQLLARYRIQAHYLAHHCFLARRQVLQAAAQLHGVPVALVHGTQDLVCRPHNAWRVHHSCSGSRLAWAREAGHHPWHPATAALLRSASAAFATDRHFGAWPPQAQDGRT